MLITGAPIRGFDLDMFSRDDVIEALGPGLLAEQRGAAAAFSGVSNDSRVTQPGQLFVAIKTEVRDGHDYVADAIAHGAAGVVVQKTVSAPAAVSVFEVSDSRHAIGELARHWRQRFLAPSIVVTGNVGKTTTKEAIAAILSRRHQVLKSPANFNDEVGLAMTLFGLNETHDVAVLEVGMFELGEIRRLCEIARPDTAVVLNVGPTHLERLGSMEAIAAAKFEAVESLPAHGAAILNMDDPFVSAMAGKTTARVLSFGIENRADFRASDILSHGLQGCEFTLNCLGRSLPVHSPLPGRQLVINGLAAITTAVSVGFSVEEAAQALSAATIPTRLQTHRSQRGALILDDSYNASPASMLAALGVLAETPGRHIALLGDMLELGAAEADGHRSVGQQAARVTDVLLTVGHRGAMIAAAAQAAGAPQVHHCQSAEEAVERLKALLEPEDVLLIKASHGMALHRVVEELAE